MLHKLIVPCYCNTLLTCPVVSQQIELRLLPRIVGIQIGKPLIVFLQMRSLQVFQAAASLVELRLQNLHIFLRELQFEARHFPAQVRFTNQPGLAADVERKFAALFLQSKVCGVRSECANATADEVREAKIGMLDLQAKNDVIPLEFVEKSQCSR